MELLKAGKLNYMIENEPATVVRCSTALGYETVALLSSPTCRDEVTLVDFENTYEEVRREHG